MLLNFIRTSLRHLQKNRTFGLINILGLSIGILCCLYIVLYVLDQFSYDKQHKNAEDIYRVTCDLSMKGDKHLIATTSPPIAPAMKKEFPEVQQFTRVIPTLGVSTHILRYGSQSFYEKQAVLVDSTFFDVFTYHFTAGSPATAFTDPSSIVLMKPIADKLFGTESPIGKTIGMDDNWGRRNYKVTAVIDESLGKSHLQSGIFLSINALDDFKNDNVWTGHNFASSYIKLQHGADAAPLEKKLPAFVETHAGNDLRSRGYEKTLHLQPVTDIHTESGYVTELNHTVNKGFLQLLLLIAILIQVIACINFMNLSTARASRRAKEVGVRKVIGAGRKGLIIQFLTESFTLTILSVLIALPLLALTLPYLNQVTQSDISFTALWNPRIWLILGAIMLLTALIAGSYPAFYLSAFNAVKVMKGNFTNHISAAGIRRGLVVFQFVVSISLTTGIIVIYSQLNYIKGKDLGFDHTQQVIFPFHTNTSKAGMDAFMRDLSALPEVRDVSKADSYPGNSTYHNWGVFLAGGNLSTAVLQSNTGTDEHFIPAMGMSLLKGRNFHLHDSGRVVINEALVRRLGLTMDRAVGTMLYTEDASRRLEVVGVVKDFNFQSLHDEVTPFMLLYNPNSEDINNVIIRTDAKDYKSLLSKIESLWRADVPGSPFDYQFFDEHVAKQYSTEVNLSRIVNSFTSIAILISCLGLFGLAAFNAEQRRKEISIRKVLGAGVPSIVRLQSKEFFQLLLISFVLAIPIAWWMLYKWLQNFAYRIDISWWMFAVAGLAAIIIALGTIGYQAIRTAIANPLKGLRSE